MKRNRSENCCCRGEKCAQYPQISICSSHSLKRDVVELTDRLGVSISSWVRGLMERELSARTGHDTQKQKE